MNGQIDEERVIEILDSHRMLELVAKHLTKQASTLFSPEDADQSVRFICEVFTSEVFSTDIVCIQITDMIFLLLFLKLCLESLPLIKIGPTKISLWQFHDKNGRKFSLFRLDMYLNQSTTNILFSQDRYADNQTMQTLVDIKGRGWLAIFKCPHRYLWIFFQVAIDVNLFFQIAGPLNDNIFTQNQYLNHVC